jgi:hypothetical protein
MGYVAEAGSPLEVMAGHPPGAGQHLIGWQPKFARDASALAASLPDDGLDLTGLVGALERQPTTGAPRSYRVAEFTQVVDPGQTAVADYLRRGPAELWVLGYAVRGGRPLPRRRVEVTQRVRALSAAWAYSSAARQQYQASTERYGRYGSPSGWISRAVGVGTCQASP